jgi:hypothetical protein
LSLLICRTIEITSFFVFFFIFFFFQVQLHTRENKRGNGVRMGDFEED